jgi:hypothetical protein
MSDTSTVFLFQTVKVYDGLERTGVTWISTAGLLSLFAILILLVAAKPKNAYPRTHVIAYYFSLLAANAIQSAGTVMNLHWVIKGEIDAGSFCSLQGGIKQTGNVATAIWSFIIALHLFNILFLRFPTTKAGLVATLCFGWASVATIVIVGPAVIQTPEKGPYFSISGNWCWITDNYPKEQTFLEYFFEFFSAGVGFLFYVAILLRVRGNLYQVDDKWRFRSLPSGQSWQLAVGRDQIDSAMLKAAKNMVWYPVAYTVILIPISLARLVEFSGGQVPDWALIATDVLYNLTGFVNVIIFLATRRFFPDVGSLPEFTTPRKQFRDSFVASGGVLPFPLPQSAEKKEENESVGQVPQQSLRSSRRFSVSTLDTTSSQTPLRLPERVLTFFSKPVRG